MSSLLFTPAVCLLTVQNGQVYVVENNNLLRPLVKTAALSCINPNVWFDHRTWSPGTLTNYASSKRLFRESHQPNRKYVRPALNPCPTCVCLLVALQLQPLSGAQLPCLGCVVLLLSHDGNGAASTHVATALYICVARVEAFRVCRLCILWVFEHIRILPPFGSAMSLQPLTIPYLLRWLM